jgi:hypothetical protein
MKPTEANVDWRLSEHQFFRIISVLKDFCKELDDCLKSSVKAYFYSIEKLVASFNNEKT